LLGPWLALSVAGRAAQPYSARRPRSAPPDHHRRRRHGRAGCRTGGAYPRARWSPPDRQRRIQQRCAPPAPTAGRSRTRLCLLAVTRPCRDSSLVGFGKSHCLRRNSRLRKSPPASKGISFRAGEHDRAEKPPARWPQQALSPSTHLFDMEPPKPRQGAVPPLPHSCIIRACAKAGGGSTTPKDRRERRASHQHLTAGPAPHPSLGCGRGEPRPGSSASPGLAQATACRARPRTRSSAAPRVRAGSSARERDRQATWPSGRTSTAPSSSTP
jgi:hypothetical protein